MTHSFRCCLNQLYVVRMAMLLLLLALATHSRLQAQNCNPDLTPPTAVCNELVMVALEPFGSNTNVDADAFDDSSYDDCCLDTLLVRRLADGPCDGDTAADPFAGFAAFCCADIGNEITVVVRAVDCSGNFNDCLALVHVEDKSGPSVVTDEITAVALGGNGTVSILATTFDDGTYDNCCLDTLLVRRLNDGPCDADTDPDAFAGSVTFCCADLDQEIVVVIRAVDCYGNYTDGFTTVTVSDKLKPTCAPPANVTVSCENFDPSLVAYGMAIGTDNCCVDTVTATANYSQFNADCLTGTIVRTFEVADCSPFPNTKTCTQTITVNHEQHYFVQFPNDQILNGPYQPGQAYGGPSYFGEDCELLGHSFTDEVIGLGADSLLLVERTWHIINWCTYDPNLPVIQIPNPHPNPIENHVSNLPGPIVSDIPATAPADPWQATLVKINPTDPVATDFSTFFQANANGYGYKQLLKFIVPLATVQGRVFRDNSANCAYENGEAGLAGWKVKLQGMNTKLNYKGVSDANGRYSIVVLASDVDVEGALETAINYGQSCASSFVVKTTANQAVSRDIPVRLKQDCDLLSVDLSTPFLHRCQPNTYTVKVSNLGAATVKGANASMYLDSYMSFTSTTWPSYISIGGNSYVFYMGDLQPGETKTFKVQFNLSCNAPLGYTHKTGASVGPYAECNVSPAWSGADLSVFGFCDADSVRFVVKNSGNGDMSAAQEFVVVEDVIMYKTLPLKIKSFERFNFAVPANGATWRAYIPEEPNHPWGGTVSLAIEGCGGIRQTGLVNLFPNNTPNPFETVDTRQNTDLVEDNSKMSFPEGYGPAKLIDANTDIEYMVLFQNQGNTTARSVVVTDTLPLELDITSVRPGASSHPYDFSIVNDRVVRLRFDNIQLPDSSASQAGSYGWVKYRVAQRPNNPVGTRIITHAGVSFDNRPPVMTNGTLHTIGDHFVSVGNHDPVSAYGQVKVSPNPASDFLLFEWPVSLPEAQLELVNAYGQKVRTAQIGGTQYRLERNQLASGVYYYNIAVGGQTAWTGKVVLTNDGR